MFVFDSLSNKLPVSFSNFFIQSRDAHSYNTRNSKNRKLVLPKFKSVKYGKNAIRYQSYFLNGTNLSLKSIILFLQNIETIFIYKSILDLNRNQLKKLVHKIT